MMSLVGADLERVKEACRERGHRGATVEAVTKIDEKARTIALTVAVSRCGP